MLKDIIIPITEQYHNTGHINPIIDRMMDSASGRGHRLEYGHDMQALIESYHLDGIEGIGSWFDHMAKDFTSTDGIPLPFANAIKDATGMNTTEAVDWLCINASDAIELGGQAALMQLFKNKPSMYKAAVIIGFALGILDDNPLLVAFNSVLVLKGLKNTGRLDAVFKNTGNILGKCWNVVSRVSIGVAVANLGLGIVGINLSEAINNTFSSADSIDSISDVADWGDIGSMGADIIDGFSTIGLGIIFSKGVKKIFNSVNKVKIDALNKSQTKLLWKKVLQNSIASKASPMQLSAIISFVKNSGAYKAVF